MRDPTISIGEGFRPPRKPSKTALRAALYARISKSKIARRLNIGRTSVRVSYHPKRADTATKRAETAQDIYQIRVTLLGTKPPIWRRLLVPALMTLARLHDALQTAMGWHDCHMHEFRAGDRHFGRPDPEDLSMGMRVESERNIKLSTSLRSSASPAHAFSSIVRRLVCEYDTTLA